MQHNSSTPGPRFSPLDSFTRDAFNRSKSMSNPQMPNFSVVPSGSNITCTSAESGSSLSSKVTKISTYNNTPNTIASTSVLEVDVVPHVPSAEDSSVIAAVLSGAPLTAFSSGLHRDPLESGPKVTSPMSDVASLNAVGCVVLSTAVVESQSSPTLDRVSGHVEGPESMNNYRFFYQVL